MKRGKGSKIGKIRYTQFIAILLLLLPVRLADGQSWTTFETNGEIEPRQDGGFVACRGKFYLLGGYGIAPIDIYDPTTKRWSKGAAPPVEMHHFQAERYGEQIYVLGAFTGIYPDEKPLEYIYVYDIPTDTWKKGDPIPEDRIRGSSGVVAYRGELYMICGTQDRREGLATNWVDVYDTRTGHWKKLANAPRSRDYFHAAMINGKIYAAGGRITSWPSGEIWDHTVPEVDVYNIAANRWKTLPEEQNLPTRRAGCSTVAILDHLVVIGGENRSQQQAYDVVEAYDVAKGKWETWESLKQGRTGTQAFMSVGSVFVASGTGLRDSNLALSTLEVLEF
jgi:hypothetical protein